MVVLRIFDVVSTHIPLQKERSVDLPTEEGVQMNMVNKRTVVHTFGTTAITSSPISSSSGLPHSYRR